MYYIAKTIDDGDNTYVSTTLGQSSHLSFDELPYEILQQIFEFGLDLPTVSALTRTSKSHVLSEMASSKEIWSILMTRRFNITTRNKGASNPRPTSYGGSDWKEAYISLSLTNRIPKSRFTTKRKAVFAKNSHRQCLSETHDLCKERFAEQCTGVSLWVMIGHTEDCRTRNVSRYGNRRRRSRSFDGEERSELDDSGGLEGEDLEYLFDGAASWRRYLPPHTTHLAPRSVNSAQQRQQERYIELHVCLQNTRTGCGFIDVDFREARVQLMDGSRIGVVSAGVRRPRVLLHMAHGESGNVKKGPASRARIKNQVLKLNPLEYVVVALNVACTSDVLYETDFLTRVECMYVPITPTVQVRLTEKDIMIMQHQKMISDPKIDCTSVTSNDYVGVPDGPLTTSWANVSYRALASAPFLPEKEVWKHYDQLPGGCLTLVEPCNLNLT